jgi:DNA-binding NarL/FixJ family response regulator
MSQSFRIALIDWNLGFRSARRQILDATPGLEVVFESDGRSSELQQLPDLLVDVIVIDQQLEQGSGVETFLAIRNSYQELSQVPKAVLTAAFDLPGLRLVCYAAGMQELVSVADGPSGLTRAIGAAAKQETLSDLQQLVNLVRLDKAGTKSDFTFAQAISGLPIRKKSIIDKLARDWSALQSGSKPKFSIEQLEPLLVPLGCLTIIELVIRLLQNGFLDGE